MRWWGLAPLGFCAVLCMGEAPNKGVSRTPGAQPQHTQAYPPQAPPLAVVAYGRAYVLASQAAKEEPAEKFLWFRADGWVAVFTFVLGLSTILLWLETKRLAKDGERSIGAAVKAAEAAEKSAETAERALVNLEGAIIRPDEIRFRYTPTAGEILFRFRNFGRSPATVSRLSVSAIITPANNPGHIQERADRAFMFEEMIAEKESSEQLVFTDGILGQYASLVESGQIDLHFMINYSWESLLGKKVGGGTRFIWSPKRGRFLGGIQLWDDPQRFPPRAGAQHQNKS